MTYVEIPNFKYYKINEQGDILSVRSVRNIKSFVRGRKLYVSLLSDDNSKRINKPVGELMLLSFKGLNAKHKKINYIDGNISNVSLSNLQLVENTGTKIGKLDVTTIEANEGDIFVCDKDFAILKTVESIRQLSAYSKDSRLILGRIYDYNNNCDKISKMLTFKDGMGNEYVVMNRWTFDNLDTSSPDEVSYVDDEDDLIIS